MPQTAVEALKRLRALGSPEAAAFAARYFKTGPGQYGEGDVFLGLRVPVLRKLARESRDLGDGEVLSLLRSEYHEARLLALLILVLAASRGDEARKRRAYDLYLANTRSVNNWDLVDASAREIVGGYLHDKDRGPLHGLARSEILWERRIAIVATHFSIARHDFADTLRISEVLLGDPNDLIHKAAGWMLREVGKRDRATLEGFLAIHHRAMPRTMLRYAIYPCEHGHRLFGINNLWKIRITNEFGHHSPRPKPPDFRVILVARTGFGSIPNPSSTPHRWAFPMWFRHEVDEYSVPLEG